MMMSNSLYKRIHSTNRPIVWLAIAISPIILSGCITVAGTPAARAQAPPFAVSVPEVLSLFQERGFKLVERTLPSDSVPARQGAEELLLLQKE